MIYYVISTLHTQNRIYIYIYIYIYISIYISQIKAQIKHNNVRDSE